MDEFSYANASSPEVNRSIKNGTEKTFSHAEYSNSLEFKDHNSSSKISEDDYYWDFWEYYDCILEQRIPDSLKMAFLYSNSVVSLIIWLLAMFGNILILCIVLQRKHRKASTSIYLISLAIADLTVSLFAFRRGLATFGIMLFASSEFGCKLFIISYGLKSACNIASSWTLVVLTIERMFSVCIPHKVKIFCTLRNARITLILAWTFSLSIGFLNVFLAGTVYFEPIKMFCFIKSNSFTAFYNAYYIWFFYLMEILIPWFSLLIMSITIIIFLKRKRNKISKTSRTNYITVIIISANFIFLITKFSYAFFYLYYQFVYDTGNLETYLYYQFLKDTFLVYKDINNALNFYMYFVTGSRFRKEIKLFFSACWFNFKRTSSRLGRK